MFPINNTQYKAFSIVFLFLFTSILISILAYHLNFNIENTNTVSKILFFDKFIVEYIITSLLLIIFVNKNKISLFIAFIIFIFYISIASIQLITFLISREFLSKLAISNVEFIGFLITFENILIILQTLIVLFIVPFFISRYIIKQINIKHLVTKKVFFLFLFLIVIVIANNHRFIKEDIINKRDVLLTKNYFLHTATLQAFIDIFE